MILEKTAAGVRPEGVANQFPCDILFLKHILLINSTFVFANGSFT